LSYSFRERKSELFLAGLAILSLRGFLYPLSDDRFWLFAVQSLDGVGLYGALFPLVVADLTRGTGHFNLAQGAVITAQGIGAALSTSLAGLVVVYAAFSAAFLVLAGIAASDFCCISLACRKRGILMNPHPVRFMKKPRRERHEQPTGSW
jgi:Major Facilitator Superfamily